MGLEEGDDLTDDEAEMQEQFVDVGAIVVDDDVAELHAGVVVYEAHSVLVVGERGRRVDLVSNERVESSIGAVVAVDLRPHFARAVAFLNERLYVLRLPNEHDQQRVENVGELVRVRGETASKMPQHRVDIGDHSQLDLEVRPVAPKQLAVLREDDALVHQVHQREVGLGQAAEERHPPENVDVALVGALQFGRKQQASRDDRGEIRLPSLVGHMPRRQIEQEKHAFPRRVLCMSELARTQRIPWGSI